MWCDSLPFDNKSLAQAEADRQAMQNPGQIAIVSYEDKANAFQWLTVCALLFMGLYGLKCIVRGIWFLFDPEGASRFGDRED